MEPNQTQGFGGFGKLPRELRDEIWDLAIRDDHPGAHFFSISAGHFSPTVHWTVFGYNDTHGMRQFARLLISAPRYSGITAAGPLWTTNNPSTYVRDSGLWTACRESREAIQKSCARSRYALVSNFEPGRTGLLINGEGRKQYFTVFIQDLIIFQPLNPVQVDQDYGFGFPLARKALHPSRQ